MADFSTCQRKKNIILLTVLLFSLCTPSESLRPLRFQPHWNPVPGEPGVRIRLTRKGISQLKERISALSGYRTTHPFYSPTGHGTLHLSNLRILQFAPAQATVVSFLPPRSVVFGLEGMSVVLASDFVAETDDRLIRVTGRTEGSLQGMTVAITTELLLNPSDGSLSARVSNCSSIIASSQFTLSPEGPLGPIVKTFEAYINSVVRERIPSMLCSRLSQLLEKNSPRLFAKLTRTDFGDKIDPRSVAEHNLTQSFIGRLVHGLFIDNANVAPPAITPDYLETQMKGEIRYDDGNPVQVPFYPRPMSVPESSDRMLHIFVSDYLFNSFLFHAYQRQKLTVEVNRVNVPQGYQHALDTSCSAKGEGLLSSICVGHLLPSISSAFPNTSTSFLLIPSEMPDFQFNGESAAVGLDMRILSYVEPGSPNLRRRQILVAEAKGQADFQLHADKDRLFGDFHLNKLSVHLHRASVPGIDPESVEQLSPLARTFLGTQMSERLKRGMPFPLKDSVTLLNPNFRIDDGFIELATDFVINERALRHKIHEAFATLDI